MSPRPLQLSLCAALTLSFACTEPALRKRGEVEPDPDGGSQPDGGAGDAGEPAPFLDDFQQANSVMSAPWRRSAEGVATVLDGRLCLADGGSAELVLSPGQLRYLRVDVPPATGLRMEVLNPDGLLFAVDFQDDVRTGDGAFVMSHPLWEVAALEVEVDYAGRSARVGEREGRWVPAPFSASATEAEATAVRFRVTAEGVAPHYAVCLDNLFVGPEAPSLNPFVGSPSVNPWVSDTRDASRCITTQCRNPMLAYVEEHCTCTPASCTCVPDIAPCAADCLQDHPSGMFSSCTSVCRRDADWLSSELLECIDTACGVEPRQLEPDWQAVSWPAERPKAPDSEWLATFETENQGELELGAIDFAWPFYPDVWGTLDVSRREAVQLSTESTHTRVIADAVFDGLHKLSTWQDGRFVEHKFPAPIVGLEPSPSRRYVWVNTRGAHTSRVAYLVTYDGLVLYRRETHSNDPWFEQPAPMYGPDDAYAVLSENFPSEHVVTTLRFASGQLTTERYPKPADERWYPEWAFEEGTL
jgi:hypothetical protein